MVFVTVRENDPRQPVRPFLDESRVRQYDVDAGGRVIAKGDAHIDDDPLLIVRLAQAVQIEVHADLFGAAEGHEEQMFVGIGHLVVEAVDRQQSAQGEVGIAVMDGVGRLVKQLGQSARRDHRHGRAELPGDAGGHAFDDADVPPEDA